MSARHREARDPDHYAEAGGRVTGRKPARRFPWGLVAVAVLALGLMLWLMVGGKKADKAPRNPSVAVTATQVQVRDVPVAVQALGSAQAWQGVLIKAQVNGRLLAVPAKEGQDIKQGQLVAQIDPAPYQAALLQAKGTLARDEAMLANAKLDLQRYQQLAAQDSIAKQQVDTQEALVKQDEGTVELDQGQVAAAQVNVNFTRILSPVTGRVSIRLVDPGNVVSTTDTTGIISINQLSPIAVTFTVPQGDFQRLSDVSDNFRKPMVTQAFSQETGAPLGQGELSIADNHVDPSTGSVQMKARFPNTDMKLWPGQQINIRLTLQTMPRQIVIPSVAVNQGPNGPYAYVVGANNKVSVRPVQVLTTQDNLSIIKSGLKPGETVVTDGQMSLKPGASVRIRTPGQSKRPNA